jgi:hypothetical protein
MRRSNRGSHPPADSILVMIGAFPLPTCTHEAVRIRVDHGLKTSRASSAATSSFRLRNFWHAIYIGRYPSLFRTTWAAGSAHQDSQGVSSDVRIVEERAMTWQKPSVILYHKLSWFKLMRNSNAGAGISL